MKLLLLVVLVWMVSDDASANFIDSSNSELAASSPRHKYRNLALQGRATMSSIYRDTSSHLGYLAMADNGNDGNLDSDYYHGSCFHTHIEPSPWWRVDLLWSYRISHITITNRGDCCGVRLNGAEILVGDSLTNNGNNNPRCAQVTSVPDGATQSYFCRDMVGRYVNIVLTGKTECLHLCEVQVFGRNLKDDEHTCF